MSKHSEGPWEIEARPLDVGVIMLELHGEDLTAVVVNRDNRTTGVVALMGNSERAQANARLIAAAPDLLVALKEAVEFADQDFQALTPAGEAMTERWKAAIAKAEGLS